MTHAHPSQEGEHAAHHAHDPFDRRVALSMVVIAAVLASVKVVAHRAHNDTLGYQIKASVENTAASNYWSQFQSKRQRQELAMIQAAQLELIVPLGAKPGQREMPQMPLPKKEDRLKSIEKDLSDEEVKDAGEQAAKIVEEGEKRFNELCKRHFSEDQAIKLVALEMNIRRYRLEGEAIMKRAKKQEEKVKEYQEKSKKVHSQANYFDLGELGVELALVLSSVAILTKRKGYWFAGMGLGVIGVIIAIFGFLLG
jgi:phage terminase Nu1 subunit (DNA packaging protein)